MTRPRSPWPSPACPPAGTEAANVPLPPQQGPLFSWPQVRNHFIHLQVNILCSSAGAAPAGGVFSRPPKRLEPQSFADTCPTRNKVLGWDSGYLCLRNNLFHSWGNLSGSYKWPISCVRALR